MTATLIQTKEVKAIDWSKPMILQSKETQAIVLSNGSHTEYSFTGTILCEGFSSNSIGDVHTLLDKNSFVLIPNPITITFSND